MDSYPVSDVLSAVLLDASAYVWVPLTEKLRILFFPESSSVLKYIIMIGLEAGWTPLPVVLWPHQDTCVQ